MKLGKIYKCDEDQEWVQATSEHSVNTISCQKGLSIGHFQNLSYYEGKLTKVTKKERQWFLDCVAAREILPQENYKSKKDKFIEELVEQNYMLVEALEQLCPGYKEANLTEVTTEI